MAYRVSNPGVCGGVLPVELITDRAKRYRANSEQCKPDGPKVCACGSKTNIGVGHLDGNEDNGARKNLAWQCKRCNALQLHADKAAGRGKRTRQYNPQTPEKGKRKSRRGSPHSPESKGRNGRPKVNPSLHSPQEGPRTKKDRPSSDLQYKRLGIPNLAAYSIAASEHQRGTYDKAGEIIHATPLHVRRQYAREIAARKRERGTDKRNRDIPF